MITKVCTKCKVNRIISNFRKRGYYKDGSIMYQSICKICEKEYNKRYYENHLDDKKKYYEDNKIKLKEQNKKWNEETGYAKSWRDANKGRRYLKLRKEKSHV